MKFDKWPRGGCGIYENNACLMFLSRFIHEPSHKCQNRIHLLAGNPVVPPLLPPSPLSSRSTTLGEANASPPKPTSSQHAARVRPSKSTPNSLANRRIAPSQGPYPILGVAFGPHPTSPPSSVSPYHRRRWGRRRRRRLGALNLLPPDPPPGRVAELQIAA